MAKTKAQARIQEALDLLIEDHREVQAAFEAYDELPEDAETRRAHVQQTCLALSLHAQLEDEVFYPALRDRLDDPSLVEEAMVEHQSARDLIEQLEGADPDEDLYDARFKVLGEYVNHHIEEEEGELFDAIRKQKLDLDDVADSLSQRRQALRAAAGLDDAADDEA